MDSAKGSSQVHTSDGEDLSILFYKSGRSLKYLSKSVGKGFTRFGNAILLTILFLMRNFLWIALGTIIGLGYGIYLLNKSGSSYSSEMTVKANFNSARSLYNTMDYLNALISNRQTDDLAHIFGIEEKDAKRLSNFKAQPLETELIISDIYKEQFLNLNRSSIIRQDTFWLRTLKYNEFKESLTPFDYPLHKITVISTNPAVFGKLEKGIIDHVSNNSLFQEIRKRQAGSNKEEEDLLQSAIYKLDTLRQAYNQRLIRGADAAIPGGNQLTVLQSTPNIKTPELEVFDKMMELIDALKKSRTRAITEKDIIEVYSPFNVVGQKISFLQQNVAKYSLIGFGLSLLILLLIAFYKYLLAFERTRASRLSTEDIPNVKS
jgi:hypothetical protein